MKNKKQPFKMILTGMLCTLWLIPMGFSQMLFMPVTSYADTGTVIIAADTSVHVGDTLNVTVKYTAAGLGLIDGELRYDPDMLKYVSGGTSANPSGGAIKMNKEMAGESTQLFTIRFVAVGAGSDFFLVNTFQLKDGDGNDLGKPGASVKLIVTDVADQPEPDDPIVAPDDPADNPAIDTPDTTEDPGTEDPATEEPAVDTDGNNGETDMAADESTSQDAPDTLLVFVGAIGITTIFLVLSIILVKRRRKQQ